MKKIKFYDTSSLLLKADTLFETQEEFAISSITLNELENIKSSAHKDIDIKYAARKLINKLDENIGKYQVIFYTDDFLPPLLERGIDEINNDAKILACGFSLKASGVWDIEFVTNDICLKHLAMLFFSNVSSVQEVEDDYLGYKNLILTENEMLDFYSNQNDNSFDLLINQYGIFYNEDKEIVDVRRWDGETYQFLDAKPISSKYFGRIAPQDLYQKMALDSLRNNQLTVLRGKAGSGKAQPNSTLIPTKNGYIKMGDIKIGDKVLDRFGNETTVLNVFPQGLKDNYKITFSDGRIAYCNDEHIWTCYTSRKNFKDFTVREMLDKGLTTTNGTWRFKIPIAQAVEYPEKKYEIDPYVMGAFLGDGCCKEIKLSLSSTDKELVEEVSRLIGAKSYKKQSEHSYTWIFELPNEDKYKNNTNFHTLVQFYQTKQYFKNFPEMLQYAYDKKIPEEYKFGSIEQRYALIQGLMDTDGTIDNASKGRTSFTSTSLQLIKDLQEVCWSLGFSASIHQDGRSDKYTKECYKLIISCSKENKPKLFRLKRKKDIAVQYMENGINSVHSETLTIKAIEKMPEQEEMTCIYVDNSEHLYLTEQFIVTHNSLIGLSYLFSLLEQYKIDRLYIFCNPVATRDSARLGFYPGSKDQKLLDSQIGNFLVSKLGDITAVEQLIDQGKLILIPAADSRGVDIPENSGVYITEAQNSTRDLMRLLVQRIGEGTKVVIEGDDRSQVDLNTYAGVNNGLKALSKAFRGEKPYGEVRLQQIHRSELTRIAERI